VKAADFRATMNRQAPPAEWSAPTGALWWDGKGDWAKAHALVNELETIEGMAVHAYLHRKEGDLGNAEYWYRRAGSRFRRETLEQEWEALVEELGPDAEKPATPAQRPGT
jgi:hypothetical protein